MPPPKLDEHGDSIRSMGWRAFRRWQILSPACLRAPAARPSCSFTT